MSGGIPATVFARMQFNPTLLVLFSSALLSAAPLSKVERYMRFQTALKSHFASIPAWLSGYASLKLFELYLHR